MKQIDSEVFATLNTINMSCWEANQRLKRLVNDQNDAAEEAVVSVLQKEIFEHIRAVARAVNDDLRGEHLCSSMALLLRITRQQAEKDLSRITCERDLLDAIIADLNQVDTQLHAHLPA